MPNKQTRILITGPIFDTPSGPSGSPGKLYTKLREEGFVVYKKSKYRNKILRFADTLIGVLSFHKYDIILVQCFGLFAFYLEDMISRFGKIWNKPVVFTIRGGAFHEFYEQHPTWCHQVLSRVTQINTPSYFLQKFLQEKGHVVEYIPNFIQLENFTYKREIVNPYSFLWVRAFHDIYHPELVIESFYEVYKKYPQAILTMIGPDQGLKAKCMELIEKLNLTKCIHLLGPIPNKELANYFHTHAVYTNTTRYESFGVALIEAGSCGIPCVSSSAGEIPWIWEDKKNILLAERNANAFSNAMLFLVENKEAANEMGWQASQLVKKYNWENTKKYWLETIKTCVG